MAYQKKHERGDREDRGEFATRRRPAIPANDKIDHHPRPRDGRHRDAAAPDQEGRPPRAQHGPDGLRKERRPWLK